MSIKNKRKPEEKTPIYRKPSGPQIGIIHIKFRENNMIYTLTDLRGNTQNIVTGGLLGYKNAQKSTWTTARECAIQIVKKGHDRGYGRFYINIRGYCSKRRSVLRVFSRIKCKIERVLYRSLVPYNGCRGFKKSRK